MTNPLVYQPKIRKDKPVTGVKVSPLGGRHGDMALAKGATDLIKSTVALKDHLDGIDDTNNFNRMAAQMDIRMGEALIGIEANNNPDTYSEDVKEAFRKVTKDIGDTYKFKTQKYQLMYNGLLQDNGAKYETAADRKQADMRISRAQIGVMDNRQLARQSAAMNQFHKVAQAELEEKLQSISSEAQAAGLEYPDVSSKADRKILTANDWHYAQNYAKERPKDFKRWAKAMDKKTGKESEEFYKQYKYLLPEHLDRLLQIADQQIKINDAHSRDKKNQLEDEWDRKYIDRMDNFFKAKTPEERLAAVEDLRAFIPTGAEIKGASFVESAMRRAYDTKTLPSRQMYLQFMNDIDNGAYTHNKDWVQAGMAGNLKVEWVKDLDRHLELYKKNHGQVNQWKTPGGIWDMADRKFGKDKATPNYQRFILTMKHVQREANFSNSNPDLHRAAKKLLDTIEESVDYGEVENKGLFEGRFELEDLLDEYKPWEHPGKRWKYSNQWDMRIPSATPDEISRVKRLIEEENEKRRRAGRTIKRVTPAIMQMTLSWCREHPE